MNKDRVSPIGSVFIRTVIALWTLLQNVLLRTSSGRQWTPSRRVPHRNRKGLRFLPRLRALPLFKDPIPISVDSLPLSGSAFSDRSSPGMSRLPRYVPVANHPLLSSRFFSGCLYDTDFSINSGPAILSYRENSTSVPLKYNYSSNPPPYRWVFPV